MIGVVKTNEEKPLSSGQIESNIKNLKAKLEKNTSSLFCQLRANLEDVSTSELSWRKPLASQVISDDSILVQRLSKQLQETFMVSNILNIPYKVKLVDN